VFWSFHPINKLHKFYKFIIKKINISFFIKFVILVSLI